MARDIPTIDSPIDQLARAFIDCTLPKSEWTHEAHLRVGLWHVVKFGQADALVHLRSRIRRFNESIGGVNSDSSGYHETITSFYVQQIALFLARSNLDCSLEELAKDLIMQFQNQDLILRYWKKSTLFSVTARREWVPPDLCPLPLGVQ